MREQSWMGEIRGGSGRRWGGDEMVKMQYIFRVSKICFKFFKEKRQDTWSECIFSVASS